MDTVLFWWVRRAKWQKAFFITLVLSFLLLVAGRAHPLNALLLGAIWGVMVAFAVWASEKLKQKMRR